MNNQIYLIKQNGQVIQSTSMQQMDSYINTKYANCNVNKLVQCGSVIVFKSPKQSIIYSNSLLFKKQAQIVCSIVTGSQHILIDTPAINTKIKAMSSSQSVVIKKALSGNKGLIKMAKHSTDFYSPDNQQSSGFSMGDTRRYGIDSYSFYVTLSNTKQDIRVSITQTHAYLGGTIYNQHWVFQKGQKDKAKKLYKEINIVLQQVIQQFVKEDKSTSFLWSYVRARTAKLAIDNIVQTGLPWINNAFKYIQNDPDWQKNIYRGGYKLSKPLPLNNKTGYEMRKNQFQFSLKESN